MTNLLALPSGTELVGDYRVAKVLGAGGFGITYLADEPALARRVTIKEYFPADFAARDGTTDASPRSKDSAGDFKWGLDRFIEEAQTLARFDHPNIVRVFRYFLANKTGYMVLKFEEGQSFKGWLKGLGRAPRQAELDDIVTPLLDALELIHKGDFLHRDIAPDNIIIRKDNQPVLIDFGSARGDMVAHSRTVSALVKPGYSPYEQYATNSRNQGPWTDIYALGATLYQAIAGKRPPDAPSRMVADDYVPARDAALGSYRPNFLSGIDRALQLEVGDRPQSIAEWRGMLLAPVERAQPRSMRLGLNLGLRRAKDREAAVLAAPAPELAIAAPRDLPTPPDAPQPQGQFLDFVENLQKPLTAPPRRTRGQPAPSGGTPQSPPPAGSSSRGGLGYGPVVDAGDGSRPVVASLAPVPAIIPARQGAAPTAALDITPRPAPKVLARAEKRRPVRKATSKRWWRPLVAKLAIGLGVATTLVVYQDHLPSFATLNPTPATSRAPATPAATVVPTSVAVVPDVQPVLSIAAHRGAVLAAAFSDDGRTLHSIGADGRLKLWTAASGAAVRTIETDIATPRSAAIGLRRAVVGGLDGRIALLDLDKAEKIATAPFGDAAIVAIAFAGSIDRFAVATPDGRIALFDRTASAEPVKILDGHAGGTDALAFATATGGAPNGGNGRMLSSGADDLVRQWDISSGSLLRTYRGHGDRVTLLGLAADGRSFASSAVDGGTRLWSTSSRGLIRAIKGDGTAPAAIALSPQGATLAIAAADGTIRLYDARRGRLAAILANPAQKVAVMAFATDGQRLMSGGADGSLRIWPVTEAARRRN